MKKKMTCIVCLLVIVVVLVSLGIYFKPRKAEELSEEEHLSVLSKKIEYYYIDHIQDERVDYTDFELYPLYDNNDEFKYVLVEFKPKGYTYVYITDEWLYNTKRFPISTFDYLTCMYSVSSWWGESWKAGKFDDNGELEYTSEDYFESPFSVKDVLDEKKYLITIKQEYSGSYLIPSIMQDGKYVNLYSDELYYVEDGKSSSPQVNSGHIKFIGKPYFRMPRG